MGLEKEELKTVSFGSQVCEEIKKTEGRLSVRWEDAETCQTASPWQVSQLVKA